MFFERFPPPASPKGPAAVTEEPPVPSPFCKFVQQNASDFGFSQSHLRFHPKEV